MSTNAAITRYPHVDLETLIARAAGRPVSDRAEKHLASCEHCRREANRWSLVAGGIRGLAAGAHEAAQPALRPHAARRVLLRPRRGALMVAGSAAALVLVLAIGVAGYLRVHRSGPRTEPALAAVTGCARLEQAEGTLEQVNGSTLVIRTASGQPVTVITTATTFVALSGPLLSDITDGAAVLVRGSRSGGTIKAAIVTVGHPFSATNPPGLVRVQGTASDASAAGFILVTSSGTRIPVTTSGRTFVVIPHARLAELPAGSAVFALGYPGPAGTLSARAVAAVSQLPPGAHVAVSVRDCSPKSIDEALGAISVTAGSGR